MLVESLRKIMRRQGSSSVFSNVNGWQTPQDTSCHPPPAWKWHHGRSLARVFHKTNFTGKSGPIRFDSSGQRVGFPVDVQEVTMYRGINLIGTYKKGQFWKKGEEQVLDKASRAIDKRTRIVTSIDEEPYLMETKTVSDGVPLIGRYQFVGYCADLAELVSRNVGYDYHIRIVKDGEYGKKLPDGSWTGMIGELIKHVS
ncbi:glutamate receptor 1 [Plakobranchus ocellatus]|uniref:Glutamate receptor 1 n=1 Tax=Plakobranchus ocellatus TaxID=259542 RepID=A0AAV3YPK9_9GAST|nr:glutamate receptor 1 [Plakobranchus ocellatus]